MQSIGVLRNGGRRPPMPPSPTRGEGRKGAPSRASSWTGLSRPSTSYFACRKDVDARDEPGHDDNNCELSLGDVREPQPPRLTSSTSVDDTVGTWAPSEAREIETRVLWKTLSMPAWPFRLFSSSDTSTLFAPFESSATLPGVAEVRISALSEALIGASPCE